MLKFREKSYNKYWPNKWKKLDYSKTKGHLDTNRYCYREGHKIYTGPSKELRQNFRDGCEQYRVWLMLTA